MQREFGGVSSLLSGGGRPRRRRNLAERLWLVVAGLGAFILVAALALRL